APQVEAGKHSSTRPLAFAAVATTGVSSPDASTFRWAFEATAVFPPRGITAEFSGSKDIDATLSPDKQRARFLADMRQDASDHLGINGINIAADRIALTLL